MKTEILGLIDGYGFPAGWEISEEIFHEIRVENLNIFLVGLSAKSADNRSIFGSAGSLGGFPVERAFFELVERIATMDSVRTSNVFPPLDRDGRPSKSHLIQESSLGERGRYSASNGIALGTTFSDACQRAALELTERDLILRSWYGQIKHQVYNLDSILRGGLEKSYDLVGVNFSNKENDPVVLGIFGFPKIKDKPLVYGFGASPYQEIAEKKAEVEFIQRLGFLWEEPLLEKVDFSPSASFHQDYFLVPKNLEIIRGWVFAKHESEDIWDLNDNTEYFFDLTPHDSLKGIHIVRAFSGAKMPLIFGEWHPWVKSRKNQNLIVHPIA